MEKIKILIAEDEPDVRSIMARRIAEAGYEVAAVADGQEAWEYILTHDLDVIILDLMMPRMDGFTVLEKLRKSPPHDKWQPVIIVSAKNELADMQKGYTLEADHYLTKPCKIEDVLKSIQLMVNLIPQRKSVQEMAN